MEGESQHLSRATINAVQAESARAEKISTGENALPIRFQALCVHGKEKDLCSQGEFNKNGKCTYFFIYNSILPMHKEICFQHIHRQVIAVLPHSVTPVLVLNLALAAQSSPVGKQSKSWVSAACVSSPKQHSAGAGMSQKWKGWEGLSFPWKGKGCLRWARLPEHPACTSEVLLCYQTITSMAPEAK